MYQPQIQPLPFGAVPPPPPLSIFERIAFSTAIFLFFFFFGFLGLQNALGIHSSMYSAVYRLVIIILSTAILLSSIIKRQYPVLNMPFKAFLLYIVLMVVMLVIYQAPDFDTGAYGSAYGKIFYYYEFISYSVLPALLFCLSPGRFEFLSRNTWLIFFPTLISLIIILFFFGNILSSDYFGLLSQNTGINRSTTKEPIGFMFVISLYWVVFSKNFTKFVLGLIGLILSLYAIRISTSQSLLLSVAAVCFVTFLLSFKDKVSLSITVVLGAAGTLFAVPYIMLSRGFERLRNIIYLSDIYTYGGNYDASRIDLIRQGLALFFKSPIFGGNILTPMGGYCHFIIVDVLMAGGIIGFTLMLIIVYGCLRGALALARLSTRYYWIIMISTYISIQLLFHGKATALISMPVMLLLCANSYFGSRNRA